MSEDSVPEQREAQVIDVVPVEEKPISPKSTWRNKPRKRGPKVPYLRKVAFVQGILDGKRKGESARDAGYAESSAPTAASHLLKDPEVKSMLGKALKKYQMTNDRIVGEIDKGLKHGALGTHEQYLDKALKIMGILKQDAPSENNINIVFANIMNSIASRGIE